MRSPRWSLVAAALAAAACGRGGTPGPVDRDGDGVVAGLDCDDSNPAASAAVQGYVDADGDGAGAGPATALCTAGDLPTGYALNGGDCAPADPAAWRAVDLVDRDGDGRTRRDPAPACLGAAIPEPYRLAAAGNDCDDADPGLFRWVVLYRDQDGDGVGARPRSIPCIGAALPGGWSRLGYDANDLDATVVRDPAAEDLAWLLD